MLPTPVLSVSGKGFARLRISAWHFSPAPPILYAVRAIVYHKSRVLSRVLRDFSGGKAPGTPRLNRRRHLLSLPLWKTQRGLALRGTCSTCPGGEDHLKRRSSSPPVPPLLGCRLCPEKGGSIGFASNWRLQRYTPAGYHSGRSSKCRVGSAPPLPLRTPQRQVL